MSEVKRHRRGDVREDGLVFHSYQKTCLNGERWITPEKMAELRGKEKATGATDEYRAAKKKYRDANQEQRAAYNKNYREENREQRSEYNKRYSEENRERIRDRERARYQNDNLHRLKVNLRHRVREFLKSRKFKKGSSTEKIVGCSYTELYEHIEQQFVGDMSWSNQGTLWHVDHIVPLSSADCEAVAIKLCHFSNLQPLLAEHNQKKGSLLPEVWEQLLLQL